MRARKLPSGKYNARAYLGRDEAGKAIHKSFTADTASAAIALASAYENRYKNKVFRNSLSAGMDAFIRSKVSVLSPSTIAEYASRSRTLKKQFKTVCNKSMIAITSDDLNDVVRAFMEPHDPFKENNHAPVIASPKTVQNYFRFLSAVFKFHGLTLPPVDLPKKIRPEIYVPTKEEMDRLLAEVRGTDMYVPVLLAAFAPLRRGEIAALKYPEDFDGNIIHVHAATVTDRNGRIQTKAPKTFSSDRKILLNDEIIDAIKEQGYVTKLTADQMTDKFIRALRRAGLPHFRFHDLRHFCISYLHSIGVPDAYIMQRSGHSTDATLKRVYRHTIADQSEIMQNKALEGFQSFF